MATRPITVSLSFLRYDVAQKIALGATVPANITANAVTFVNPDVAPAALAAVNTELEIKNNAYITAGGGKKAISELKAAESAWNGLFRVTAVYVSRIAAGRAEIITLTGFDSTSGEATPAVIPVKAEPTLKAGTGGTSVKVSAPTVDGARGFLTLLMGIANGVSFEQKGRQVDVYRDGDLLLSISVNTQGKTSFEAIPTGKTVYAVSMAFNKAGIGAAGESNSVLVQ